MDDSVAIAASEKLPQRLSGWPRYFWANVLFPGRHSPAPEAIRISSILLLVLVPAVLLYPRLNFPLFEPDESRYAELPREMLLRHDYIVPYLDGEPYLEKPPLFYWLVAAAYHAFGVSAGTARLVPALALHATVLLVYFFGRRRFGERAALCGALALTLAPGFFGMGRLLVLDGLLTFCVVLSLFSGFEALRGDRFRPGWWTLSAAACGLGILTKGPVALVLVVPPLWLYRRLGGPGCPLSRRAAAAFLAIVTAVALPWYVAVCVREPEFAYTFLWEHHVMRFLMPFAHERGVWFYGPVLFAGLLPATLLAVPFLRFFTSTDPAVYERRTMDFGFLLLGGGWCVLFFTLSACKLPTYILPAFPPLALAFGWFLAGSRWNCSRLSYIAAGSTLALLAVADLVALPWYATYRSPVVRPADLVRLCGDRSVTVVCYPRSCDSVAFFLGREDLRAYRSKDIEDLRKLVRERPRTVILCTHRHALRGLKQLLPPDTPILESVHHGLGAIPGVPKPLMRVLVKLMGETALGLCDVAVVEPRPTDQPIPPAYDGVDPDPFELEDEGAQNADG
jgi:4-amino-4-deoxy-L-arabinose transferase-like glycosyltransferase